LKIRVFLGWSKFVSACVERDKKKLKKWVFGLTPLRICAISNRGFHGFISHEHEKEQGAISSHVALDP